MLISIVVPVYKVEKFLNRCIKSLINQTYREIEIILVDDGSPDKCPEMCDEWCKEDKRIKVVHKANGGLSDARNAGVQQSSGDYILFVDSDDCVSNNIVERLIDNLKSYKADIVACRYTAFSNGVPSFCYSGLNPIILGGREAAFHMMSDMCFLVTAWAKLIKKEIVEKHPFPVGRNQEDEAVTYLYYCSCKSVVVIQDALYGYYQNEKGIMKSNKKKNAIDYYLALKERVEFFSNDLKLFDLSFSLFTRGYLDCIANNYIDYDKKAFKAIIKTDIYNSFERKKYKVFLLLVFLLGKPFLKIKY